jgi:hypothetical protein
MMSVDKSILSWLWVFYNFKLSTYEYVHEFKSVSYIHQRLHQGARSLACTSFQTTITAGDKSNQRWENPSNAELLQRQHSDSTCCSLPVDLRNNAMPKHIISRDHCSRTNSSQQSNGKSQAR